MTEDAKTGLEIVTEFRERLSAIQANEEQARQRLNTAESRLRAVRQLLEIEAAAWLEQQLRERHGALFDEVASAEATLRNCHQERTLLRCPRRHQEPHFNYWRCGLCGHVWDDTPPEHY